MYGRTRHPLSSSPTATFRGHSSHPRRRPGATRLRPNDAGFGSREEPQHYPSPVAEEPDDSDKPDQWFDGMTLDLGEFGSRRGWITYWSMTAIVVGLVSLPFWLNGNRGLGSRSDPSWYSIALVSTIGVWTFFITPCGLTILQRRRRDRTRRGSAGSPTADDR